MKIGNYQYTEEHFPNNTNKTQCFVYEPPYLAKYNTSVT